MQMLDKYSEQKHHFNSIFTNKKQNKKENNKNSYLYYNSTCNRAVGGRLSLLGWGAPRPLAADLELNKPL